MTVLVQARFSILIIGHIVVGDLICADETAHDVHVFERVLGRTKDVENRMSPRPLTIYILMLILKIHDFDICMYISAYK